MSADRLPEIQPPDGDPKAGGPSKWPAGTSLEDHRCWVCQGATEYRNCKIICPRCGFTRDCSDP